MIRLMENSSIISQYDQDAQATCDFWMVRSKRTNLPCSMHGHFLLDDSSKPNTITSHQLSLFVCFLIEGRIDILMPQENYFLGSDS